MKKRWNKGLIISLSIISIGIFIILFLLAESNLGFIKKTKYSITNEKIPTEFNGYKIVLLADLHSKEFGNNNKRLIAKIDSVKPDIVVMAGDMINSWDVKAELVIELINSLAKKYQIYYVNGNHEAMNLRLSEEIRNKVNSENVHFLDNEKVELIIGDARINLYGLDLPNWVYSSIEDQENGNAPDFTISTMEKMLGVAEDSVYNVLIAHTPTKFDVYEEWGADLVLSGHMHGGMIYVPFKGGLLSPEVELFPEYTKGIYTKKDSKLVLSGGLGNGRFPIRLLNRPEICVISLKSK